MSKNAPKPSTEALDAYFASFEPIDVRPRTPSRPLPTPSRTVSRTRSGVRLCLESLEDRLALNATLDLAATLPSTVSGIEQEWVEVREQAPLSSGTVQQVDADLTHLRGTVNDIIAQIASATAPTQFENIVQGLNAGATAGSEVFTPYTYEIGTSNTGLIVGAGRNATVSVLAAQDLPGSTAVTYLPGLSGRMDHVKISDDGKWIASANNLGTIFIHDATTHQLVGSFDHPDGELLTLRFFPGTDKLLMKGFDGPGYTVDLSQQGFTLTALPNNGNGLWYGDITDTSLALAGNGNVKLYNASTQQLLRTLAPGGYTTSVDLDATGAWLAVSDNSGTVKLYNTSTGALNAQIDTGYGWIRAIQVLDANTVFVAGGSAVGQFTKSGNSFGLTHQWSAPECSSMVLKNASTLLYTTYGTVVAVATGLHEDKQVPASVTTAVNNAAAEATSLGTEVHGLAAGVPATIQELHALDTSIGAMDARIAALEAWTIDGKADRLHALTQHAADITAAVQDTTALMTTLTTFEQTLQSGDQSGLQAMRATLLAQTARLSAVADAYAAADQQFNAVDWSSLSPKTQARLFPGTAEQPAVTIAVAGIKGNEVTLSINGAAAAARSISLQHGDAYLGTRTLNATQAFQTVTLRLDSTTASGPHTVTLADAAGATVATLTLQWDATTQTLSTDDANLFTPEAMAKDDGSLTTQQLYDRALADETAQMGTVRNALTQQDLIGQVNNAIITNNLISNNNGVMTNFVQLQSEQLLYLVSNSLGAPYDFVMTYEEFNTAFFRALPQWKEENRQQTMADYHLNWYGFDYYREADHNYYYGKLYGYNMQQASLVAVCLDAALAMHRGQSPLSYINQANAIVAGGSNLGAMQVSLPSVTTVLTACNTFLEQHASEFLEFQAPYQSQINALWQSYSTGNNWAGGGSASLSANQAAEAAFTHQQNLKVIGLSEGIGSPIERMAGYVIANPGAWRAVSELPAATQAAVREAVADLQNRGASTPVTVTQELDTAGAAMQDTMFAMAPQSLHGAAGVNYQEGALQPSSISWLHDVHASGDVIMHSFTISQPMKLHGVFQSQTGMFAGMLQLQDSQGRIILQLAANSTTPTSLDQTLLADSYTLTMATPKIAAANLVTGAKFGLQADLMPTRTSHIEGTVQLGATAMPVSLRVAEFKTNGDRKTDYEATDTLNRVTTLDPTKPVWVVIHGMSNSEDTNTIAELARVLSQYDQMGIQVVTLDWNKEAADWVIPTQDAGWAPQVGQWAARELIAAGFDPALINVVGHSHGTYVGYEMASEIMRLTGGNQMNAFVALDAAGNMPLVSGYDHTNINFAAKTRNSLAFDSSFGAGSNALAATADVAMEISSSIVNPGTAHSLAVTAFTEILRHQLQSPSPFSSYISLGEVMQSSDHNRSKYSGSHYDGVFEGKIDVSVSQEVVDGQTYYRATPVSMFLWAPGDTSEETVAFNALP